MGAKDSNMYVYQVLKEIRKLKSSNSVRDSRDHPIRLPLSEWTRQHSDTIKQWSKPGPGKNRVEKNAQEKADYR